MNAVILAGGRGSRLAPWPAPKCLLPICGVTILERLLQHLLYNSPVEKVIVCTGYRHEDVKRSIQAHDWREEDVRTSFAGEDVPMGVRLLKAAADHGLDKQRTLVCYGDEIVDVHVKSLLAAHVSEPRALTFAIAPTNVTGGVVADRHAERPFICDAHLVDVNIGFVIVEPVCWGHLAPQAGLSDWINTIVANVGRSEISRVGVFVHEGRRTTVNSFADLAHAEDVWGGV